MGSKRRGWSECKAEGRKGRRKKKGRGKKGREGGNEILLC